MCVCVFVSVPSMEYSIIHVDGLCHTVLAKGNGSRHSVGMATHTEVK